MSVSEEHVARLDGCDRERAFEIAEATAAFLNLRSSPVDPEEEGLVAHWDSPEPAVWIAFIVDRTRWEDAVVYDIGLYHIDGEWRLVLGTVRDHMPRAQLHAWFAEHLGLSVTAADDLG